MKQKLPTKISVLFIYFSNQYTRVYNVCVCVCVREYALCMCESAGAQNNSSGKYARAYIMNKEKERKIHRMFGKQCIYVSINEQNT
jgi:hypothetical protein